MTTASPTPREFTSPKRKRGSADSIEYIGPLSASPARIATSLGHYPFLTSDKEKTSDRTGNGSPRSRMAGQLEGLGIQEQSISTISRTLSFEAGHSRKRVAQMTETEDHTMPYHHLPDDFNGAAQHNSLKMQNGSFTAEDSGMKSVKPDINPPTQTDLTLEASEIPSIIIDRPRAHSRSPPLDGDPEDNPMTWHASEITGHSPNDPDDDGYGINGIGFKPPAAIAWARSQRRKQQLLEYKNREAKEARQKRGERRRAGTSDESIEDNGVIVQAKAVRVRFDAM